jgi:hypothetical protein
MSTSNKNKWLKVIEFAVVSAASWLDPSTGGLLLLLKLCFQILAALQPDDEHPKQSDRK